jgi:hypothetical protein
VDFLIVVIGVLIALQITEWKAKSAERRKEAQSLAYLVEDLRGDVDRIDYAKGVGDHLYRK